MGRPQRTAPSRRGTRATGTGRDRHPVVRSAAAADGDVEIAVVQDSRAEGEAVRSLLAGEGYVVSVAANGEELVRGLEMRRPHLVLADLELPDVDGVELCRRIRLRWGTPLIFVTALDAERDVVRALEAGAADHVRRPYAERELIARIRAVLRRVTPVRPDWPSSPAPADAGVLVAGPVSVDGPHRTVTVAGQIVETSRTEFELLSYLVATPGRVRRREDIMTTVWGDRELTTTRTLDVHMRRLRLKVEKDPEYPSLLLTVRGVGFRFAADRDGPVPEP